MSRSSAGARSSLNIPRVPLRRSSRRRLPPGALLAVAALLVLASCGDSSDPVTPDGEPDIDVPGVSVEFGDETRYLDEGTTAVALVESDLDDHSYTFSASALEDAGVSLESGEILLIHGVALRRIRSVSESGGQITLQTDYATMAEAFRNADIEWSHQTNFDAAALERTELSFDGRTIAANSVSGNQLDWNYEAGPYTVRGELEAMGSTARVKIRAIKDLSIGDASASFTGEGTIKAVRSNAHVRIRDHETREFDYENEGMGGDMKLSIAAAGAGDVGLDFKTPEAVIRFPFSVGPIPAILSIKAGMVTGIDVTGNSASVTAESNFTWGGDAGIQYEGTTLNASASSDLAEAIASGGNADLAGAFGQDVSAQWGVVVPIVEVGLFGESVVPYIQPELYLRAFLSWGPVCQRIKVDYNVDGGVDLRLLGIQLGQVVDQVRIAGPWDHVVSQEGCEDSVADVGNSLPEPIWW